MKRLRFQSALLTGLFACVACGALGETSDTTGDLRSLMRDVCREQVQLLQRRDSRLRYQVQRSDHKGSTVRDQIESHDGGVARLLQHNGQALTAAENDGERQRLEAMLGSDKLQQREREETKARSSGVELLQRMPDAMLFTTAAEQVSLPDVSDRQLVIDFSPDPRFHPADMAQQILPALRGRVWIDLADRRLLRMELHNTSDVNLAWGLLAKVYAGGSIVYEQRRFEDLSVFTQIIVHLRMRELMLRTVALDTETKAGGFQRLASSPSGQDAVRLLLAQAVATRESLPAGR